MISQVELTIVTFQDSDLESEPMLWVVENRDRGRMGSCTFWEKLRVERIFMVESFVEIIFGKWKMSQDLYSTSKIIFPNIITFSSAKNCFKKYFLFILLLRRTRKEIDSRKNKFHKGCLRPLKFLRHF